MNDKIGYPLYVWMTSVFLGPIILLLNPTTREAVDYISSGAYIWFYLAASVIGGFVSSPFFLLFWFCYELLIRWQMNPLSIKVTLITIILLCCLSMLTFLSFPDINAMYDSQVLDFLGAYAVPMILGMIVYKLEKQKAQINE